MQMGLDAILEYKKRSFLLKCCSHIARSRITGSFSVFYTKACIVTMTTTDTNESDIEEKVNVSKSENK